MKRGVALSGDGIAGAAAVGVLTALQELGIPLDALSGCGSAALPAVLYCAKKQENDCKACLDTAHSLMQKNPRFRTLRRGYRTLRQQLDRCEALDIQGLKIPCAVVQTAGGGKKSYIAAPLPAMDCPELSVSPDADLAELLYKGLRGRGKRQSDLRELSARLTWPLMQMGVERVLTVRALDPDASNQPMDAKRSNVLEILVSPNEARCAEDWKKAGYQAVLSRQMEVYDWAFFAPACT